MKEAKLGCVVLLIAVLSGCGLKENLFVQGEAGIQKFTFDPNKTDASITAYVIRVSITNISSKVFEFDQVTAEIYPGLERPVPIIWRKNKSSKFFSLHQGNCMVVDYVTDLYGLAKRRQTLLISFYKGGKKIAGPYKALLPKLPSLDEMKNMYT
jgi:hypothetical protein